MGFNSGFKGLKGDIFRSVECDGFFLWGGGYVSMDACRNARPCRTKCYARVDGTAGLFLEGPGGRLSSLKDLHGFPSPRKIRT